MKPRYYHSLYINKKINKRIKTTPPQQTNLKKKKKKTISIPQIKGKKKRKNSPQGHFLIMLVIEKLQCRLREPIGLPIYKLPTQAYNQTMYVQNMKIS